MHKKTLANTGVSRPLGERLLSKLITINYYIYWVYCIS